MLLGPAASITSARPTTAAMGRPLPRLFAQVLMSGITWSLLEAVNPLLNQRIEWTWFIASQVAFGALAGWIVSRTEPIATAQTQPLAVRAGIEVGGRFRETDDEAHR